MTPTTYRRRLDLADARLLRNWPYLGDISEWVLELLITGLEYRCFWRHREFEVALDADVAGHVLGRTRTSAATILGLSRYHDTVRTTHVYTPLTLARALAS